MKLLQISLLQNQRKQKKYIIQTEALKEVDETYFCFLLSETRKLFLKTKIFYSLTEIKFHVHNFGRLRNIISGKYLFHVPLFILYS